MSIQKVTFWLLALLSPGLALAQAPDFTPILLVIDAESIIRAVLLTGAALLFALMVFVSVWELILIIRGGTYDEYGRRL